VSTDTDIVPATTTTIETQAPIGTPAATTEVEALAPLFPANEAVDFRASWDAIQIGFVDDPRLAVRSADQLVAQVMNALAASFAHERTALEGAGTGAGTDAAPLAAGSRSTEDLRVALRRYRAFFQRLLAI